MSDRTAYSVTATDAITGEQAYMAVFTVGGPNASGKGKCTAPQREATEHADHIRAGGKFSDCTVAVKAHPLPAQFKGPRRAVHYVNRQLMGMI